ncbi:helix-turn-helix domain-containing protein [Microbacterium elymi]|uniref:Helix-turn-helix transcriptional regulator n=1 Tax=Microbacterium elymi TaxID=2909587 RepID=A0ABY5NGJ8_9MICO|nr:helix-turn-helix transcriptional regulator [Microbacterium elymi]UUT34327.1 helix-turn-helix transcriptional regulator [Microbacterium elymi]
MDDYGDFVRTRRDILGMSQRDLAERSGVKQPSIAAIERGRRDPSVAAKAALDAALRLAPVGGTAGAAA